MRTSRLSWDEFFMQIAHNCSTMSTCDRANVGAVLVRDKHQLTTGFNGSLPGLPHCDDVGHLMVDGHCVRTNHAEINAIVQAALHGVSTAGSTCYLTHFPCLLCTKALVTAGIVRVVYDFDYRVDPIAQEFLALKDIVVDQVRFISANPLAVRRPIVEVSTAVNTNTPL